MMEMYAGSFKTNPNFTVILLALSAITLEIIHSDVLR